MIPASAAALAPELAPWEQFPRSKILLRNDDTDSGLLDGLPGFIGNAGVCYQYVQVFAAADAPEAFVTYLG